MSDEKKSELTPEELEKVSGGGVPFNTPSSKDQHKTPFGQSPIAGEVGGAAGSDVATPERSLGDASSQKGK